tara:strand:- start:308 stop:667 length:360 start_codon:yes stop_codon:yes gene_type:complete
MPDRFRKTITDIDSPAANAVSIADMHVPDGISIVEVGELEFPTRALYIGISGNVYCRMVNSYNDSISSSELGHSTHGANIFFQGAVAGTILPLRLNAVWANNYTDDTSNTTARGLVGLY